MRTQKYRCNCIVHCRQSVLVITKMAEEILVSGDFDGSDDEDQEPKFKYKRILNDITKIFQGWFTGQMEE